MSVAKNLRHYLVESVSFFIMYKRGEVKLAAYPDASSGNNPDNSKSMSSHIPILVNNFISLKTIAGTHEGKITIHFVNAQYQLADLSTKHLGKHRDCALI